MPYPHTIDEVAQRALLVPSGEDSVVVLEEALKALKEDQRFPLHFDTVVFLGATEILKFPDRFSLFLDVFREFQRDRAGRLALVKPGPGVEPLDAYFVASVLAHEGVDAAGFLNVALANQWLLEKGRAATGR